ncbi:hypothetical protein Bhyg_08270 [Pseudolycoriella hygida]|uniref:Uncharacterized protein n=1 Tax=Pseudolycoriella hygida TaxID=35572 RepID=A0A9Q0N4E6_9DIPT|nr:hypothetical protein Bhyg_08270 [Pseudolycoriella hygida]
MKGWIQGSRNAEREISATFNDIKASAKTKLANDHSNFSGTVTKSLNRLEEKIASIYGIDCLDGDQQLGEGGFQYQKRYTSYEMVQQSINAQERFFEDSMRNHSELMYATDRNHSEMFEMFNSTLRTFSNIVQEYLNRM